MPDSSSSQTKYLIGGPVCGAVTESSAVIKASIRNSVKRARLLLSTNSNLADPRIIEEAGRWDDPDMDYEHDIVVFLLTNLTAETQYYYGLQLDNNLDAPAQGRFKTFPPSGARRSFSFACAGCSDGDNPSAFDAIRQEPGALFFIHLGDLHYSNPKRANTAKRLNYYDRAIARSGPAALLKRLPFVYTWDDHDFFHNDTGGDKDDDTRVARLFARAAYDIYFPHYDFPNGAAQQGIYHSFQVGRALFLITDLRYNQQWYGEADGAAKTVLGQEQLAWLDGHFARAADYDLIVMTSSFPWIGDASDDHGGWADYPTARRQLANLIKQRNVTNLCQIGADAHMLAIDDGSHSGYASLPGAPGKGGFPVFVAGPLDNQGSKKGGPYSHGKSSPTGGAPGDGVASTGLFSSNRQFGLCEVVYQDANSLPVIKWSGWRVKDGLKEKKLWYEFSGGRTAP
jgi:phosphodiesterase/alkaline phosphatase D-like protein